MEDTGKGLLAMILTQLEVCNPVCACLGQKPCLSLEYKMVTTASRCFDNFYSKKNRDASSRIEKLRAKTIYGNMKSVAVTNGPLTKGNGEKYYGTLYINPESKCLVHADSYYDWLAATKGKYYCTPNLSNSLYINYELYQGTALIFDQSGANVTNTSLEADNLNKVMYPVPARFDASGNQSLDWDGIVVDPSYQLFGNYCATVPFMKPNSEFASVDLCGNFTTRRPVLPNFVFPGPLKFV